MGKLDGILQFTASIGNLSFYKTQDGYIIRRKYGPSAQRIRTDPAYARTRENNAEFARAGKATKLIRSAFDPVLRTMADNRVAGRLTRELLKVIRSDTRNPRGERTVMDGDATLLNHLELNVYCKLAKIFRAPFTGTIGSIGHSASIDIEEFVPASTIAAPGGATHFRLRSLAAVIDFSENTCNATTADSVALPLNAARLPALQLGHTLTPNIRGPVLLLLGIEFFQRVNGTLALLKDCSHKALTIVSVARETHLAARSEIEEAGAVGKLSVFLPLN